jgi:adenine-specific DNA-methyltransferase
MKYLIKVTTNKNSTILDFFAWSWTTWHAVLELNKEDWWNRKFILATNNENNICEEVTYERIKRVMTW